MSGTYSRTKGRRDRTPPFTALPNDMLDSAAFRALTSHSTRLLIAFARQFRGNNNASLYVPFALAMEWGFSNERTYGKALRQLQERGFIEMTKPPVRRGKPTAARFALTWHPIHEPIGDVRHDATPTATPSNDWRNSPLDRPAKRPAKKQKVTGKSARQRPAKVPAKNSEIAKETGKSASQTAIFVDLRPADLPADLISTRGVEVQLNGIELCVRDAEDVPWTH